MKTLLLDASIVTSREWRLFPSSSPLTSRGHADFDELWEGVDMPSQPYQNVDGMKGCDKRRKRLTGTSLFGRVGLFSYTEIDYEESRKNPCLHLAMRLQRLLI